MNGHPSPHENGAFIKDKIESIPRAMRQMGWTVSADLMEHWMRAPAWELPEAWRKDQPTSLPPSHLNQRIVRMNWAMSYGRVREAIDQLRSTMTNGPAKKLLSKRLTAQLWGREGRSNVGSLRDDAFGLETTCQSNIVAFGAKLDTMDDLYGGLGMATLKVALIGEASRDARTGRIAFKVTHAGFYIRDTYDFNGFQYLGTWKKSGVLSKTAMLANTALDGLVFRWGADPVGNLYNHDFAAYRGATGFGGDFVIYSDVYWEPVNLHLDLDPG